MSSPVAPTLPNPMALALQLAFQAGGWTAPNPMVGCVIAREVAHGQWEVLAHGYHERCGLAHAERRALEQFIILPEERKAGAVLFVTLEPCNHHGRTPPCAPAIVAAGIKRVQIAAADPNPQASGGGAALQAAGVEVAWGNMFAQAVELNAGFFKRHLTDLPFVLAKWAMTADGKIATATGDSRWISGVASRMGVMRMRATCDAVLVGYGTVLRDDPQLTARIDGAHQPLRVVADTHLQISTAANVLHGPGSRKMPDPLNRTDKQDGSAADKPRDGIASGCVVACGAGATGVTAEKIEKIKETGAEVWELPLHEGRVDLRRLLQELVTRRGVGSVLVEGGHRLLGSLFDRGLVDRVAAYVAPKILGGAGPSAVSGVGRGTMGEAHPLIDGHFQQIGEDMLLIGKAQPWPWLARWESATRQRAQATGRWVDSAV